MCWRAMKWAESVSIRTIRGKFFLLTTVLTLVPMTLLSAVFYRISVEDLGSNARASSLASVRMGERYADQALTDLEDMLTDIVGDSRMQELLLDQPSRYFNYLRSADDFEELINSFTQSKAYVKSYFIYDKNNGKDMQYFFRQGLDSKAYLPYRMFEPGAVERIYPAVKVATNLFWLFPGSGDGSPGDTFVIGKPVYSLHGQYEDIGFVLLEINASVFFQGLSFIETSERQRFYILNEAGDAVYRMPKELPFPPNARKELAERLAGSLPEGDNRDIAWQGGAYLGSSVRNAATSWTFVGLTENAKLYEDAVKIRNTTFVVFFLVFLVGWTASVLLGNSVSKPLRKLSSLILFNRTAVGGKPISFDPDDEVGQIGNRYLGVMEENRNLQAEVYGALLRRKEAEFQMLQAQINPHFLYNTLESLSGYATEHDQPEMSRILHALSRFFRIALSKGSVFIPLREEVEHVRMYMTIQRFRYRNRFEYVVEIDEELQALYVPKLILQPIVENAIYHGLRGKDSEGTIMITAERTEDGVRLQVTDDGLGLSAERLAIVREAMNAPSPDSGVYGLRNVHDRLRLQFGQRYGVELTSVKGAYTTVTLRIPELTEPGGGGTTNEREGRNEPEAPDSGADRR